MGCCPPLFLPQWALLKKRGLFLWGGGGGGGGVATGLGMVHITSLLTVVILSK